MSCCPLDYNDSSVKFTEAREEFAFKTANEVLEFESCFINSTAHTAPF